MARNARKSPAASNATEGLIAVGAAALVIGTRLPFYEVRGRVELDWNAWSNAWSLYPVLLIGAGYGLTPVVFAALARLGRPWTARRAGVSLLLATAALVTVLAYWLRDVRTSTVVLRTGAGGWVMFLGATALASGSWLMTQRFDRPPGLRMRRRVGRGEVIVAAGAAIVLVGSLLPVFRLPKIGGGHIDASAWSANFSPPLFALPLLWTVVTLAVTIWPGATLVGVDTAEVRLGTAGLAVVTMIGFLVGNPSFVAFGARVDVERGLGFWCMLLGTLITTLGVCDLSRSAKSL